MAFYFRNIGGPQRAARLALGIAATIGAFVTLSGAAAWLIAAAGLAFAATGLIGFCPACAMAGVGRKGTS